MGATMPRSLTASRPTFSILRNILYGNLPLGEFARRELADFAQSKTLST
jgi:hypothetical protein